MNAVRREKYGLREVDSFEKAIGIRPHPVNLPPLKKTEIWNSPVFQALLWQQQAIETEAELDARQAQLEALMKRVAAEERLPIEDIRRAVNVVARGPGGGGGRPQRALRALPAERTANALELRQGEEVLAPMLADGVAVGGAMQALTQQVARLQALNLEVRPRELRVHEAARAEIGDAGAEHQILSIDTQAEESRRAIAKREEETRVARRRAATISDLFSLESAGKAASLVGRGAYFLGRNVLLPVAQAALAAPGAYLEHLDRSGAAIDALADAAGAAVEGVRRLTDEPQIVKEYRERALPYTHALEELQVPSYYDGPSVVEGNEPPPRKRKARAIEGGSSSSSAPSAPSSSSSALVPSYGAMRDSRGARGDPLADVVTGMKGLVGVMKSSGVLGRGIIGPQPTY